MAAKKAKPTMTAKSDGSGLRIREIPAETFLSFAKVHGTSEEIGPIGTIFDRMSDIAENVQVYPLGLYGCGTLCAISACTVTHTQGDEPGGLKLDSIIVDRALRRRGLAGFLVAKAFHQLLSDPGLNISTIFSHAVHPATVRLLQRMSFSEPPPLGAPISSRHLDNAGRAELLAFCEIQMQRALERLNLQCAFCAVGDRRARPWCQPRGVHPRGTAFARR